MPPVTRPPLPIWLASRPWPLLLGVCAGFLACCWGGRMAAQRNPYHDFVRFYAGIAPETHFYPTYSQALQIVRERMRPGATVVIVGGNSILYGVGQRSALVWTKILEELLGPDFVVVNLAMRGAFPNEFASHVAEGLAGQGVPTIYVTIGTTIHAWASDWDGFTYRWLFWDGWGKGLIPPDERRDAWLESEFWTKYAADERMQEFRRRGLVDAVTYADDLWSTIAYEHVGTIWTPLKAGPPLGPHRNLADGDPGDQVPFERRFTEAGIPVEIRLLQGQINSPLARQLEQGQGAEQVVALYEQFLPEVLRDRTLIVFRTEAPFHTHRLSEEEFGRYRRLYDRFVEALQRGGLHAQLVGVDYPNDHYRDRSHFSEIGGRRLAHDLAPTIREMSRRLTENATSSTEDRP